jgi:hypothetical protein
MKSSAIFWFAWILLSGSNWIFAAETNFFPVTIQVHANKPVGELTPIWRFFGADEPNYAYMKDGKRTVKNYCPNSASLVARRFIFARIIC